MPCFFIVLLHSPYVPVFSATKSITLSNFKFAITSQIFLILGGIPSTANLQQVTSADSFICLPSLTLNPSPALYMTVRSTTLRCCKFDKKNYKILPTERAASTTHSMGFNFTSNVRTSAIIWLENACEWGGRKTYFFELILFHSTWVPPFLLMHISHVIPTQSLMPVTAANVRRFADWSRASRHWLLHFSSDSCAFLLLALGRAVGTGISLFLPISGPEWEAKQAAFFACHIGLCALIGALRSKDAIAVITELADERFFSDTNPGPSGIIFFFLCTSKQQRKDAVSLTIRSETREALVKIIIKVDLRGDYTRLVWS